MKNTKREGMVKRKIFKDRLREINSTEANTALALNVLKAPALPN